MSTQEINGRLPVHFSPGADFVSGVRWQRHLIGRALVRRREIEHYGGARHYYVWVCPRAKVLTSRERPQ